MIRFTLPFPPSINNYYLRTARGVIINSKGRKYRRDAILRLRELKGSFNEHQRLCVTINLFPPNKRKFDIDNRVKGLLDALQHAGLFPDDEQIDMLTVFRRDIVKDGYVAVWITECDNPTG